MNPVETVEQLTLFPPDTRDHASLLVLPGTEQAKKMTVTSGQKLLDSYVKSGPVGSLAKMLLGTSLWGSTTCLLNWRASVTPHKRLLFRLVPSVPRIEEIESSLWPTPTASETTARVNIELTATGRRVCKNGSSHSVDLATSVKMWPTPTTREWKGARTPEALAVTGRNAETNTLGDAVRIRQEGQLNPDWVECLMGFPLSWTDISGLQD